MTGLLYRAAFGDRVDTHPLPAAQGLPAWWRAVALGGQGRYAAAAAELAAIRDRSRSVVLRSLSLSTQASLLRQLGWHRSAARYDGWALALVGATPEVVAHGVEHGVEHGVDGAIPTPADARCDALTGLAADALGVGRLALAHRFLQRCRTQLDCGAVEWDSPEPSQHVGSRAGDWRQVIRLEWVSAEFHMAGGRMGPAQEHAQAAVERAYAASSRRHQVKSDLILAASMSGDQPERAGELAEMVHEETQALGLVPLTWAASMLLIALDPSPILYASCNASAETIIHRGGRLSNS